MPFDVRPELSVLRANHSLTVCALHMRHPRANRSSSRAAETWHDQERISVPVGPMCS